MSLLDSEIARLKAELGVSTLTVGAEPYIGISRLFELAIQPYTQAGAATTSATAVTAASAPTPVTITLASATGFSAGDRVVVDVDVRQEVATAQRLSGTSLTLLLSLAHTGTYPVTVEGGESIIREYLAQCVSLGAKMRAASANAGVKRVDEVEFFEPKGGSPMSAAFRALNAEREHWRRELCGVFGIIYPRDIRAGGGSTICL